MFNRTYNTVNTAVEKIDNRPYSVLISKHALASMCQLCTIKDYV